MTVDVVAARRLLGDPALARLRKLPGVSGVEVGLKMVAGQFTDEPAVVISVQRKRPARQLRRSERVPAQFAGWPTDVQENLDAAFFRPSHTETDVDLTHVRPLRSGISVAVSNVHAGTLGFLARHQASDKAVLVSNYHVLFRDRALLEGEPHPIYQPIGTNTDNKVAEMQDGRGGGSIGNELDCAFATLDVETTCFCCHTTVPHENKVEAHAITGVNHVAVGEVVTKTGIKTAQTFGKVVSVTKSINGAVDFSEYNLPAGNSFAFSNLIMVVAWDPAANVFIPQIPFADGGDSGSVLLNANREIVGLHFGSYHNPANGNRYSMACHIDKVEQALNVQVGGHRFSTPARPAPSAALSALDMDVDASMGEFAFAGTEGAVDALTWSRLRARLARTGPGREWLAFIDQRQHEIVQLVNHRRRVTVRWHRLQGPAFTAAVVRSLRVPGYDLPETISGVSLHELLLGMAEVLASEGSPGLRADVERLQPAADAALEHNRLKGSHSLVSSLADLTSDDG